jgi:pimeloyl-ACP methyl ester carboxylesterase
VERWGDRYWLHHRRRLGAMCPASYRGVGQTLFDSEPLCSRLSEIACPSCVLVGESDQDFLPGAALLAAHLPDVRCVTIAKAGHHPQQENKAAWLEAIESFIGPIHPTHSQSRQAQSRQARSKQGEEHP